MEIKLYRGDFQGILTLARPVRAGEENRRNKSWVFPKVPTKLLRGVVFGGLYGFILLLLDWIQRNPIG